MPRANLGTRAVGSEALYNMEAYSSKLHQWSLLTATNLHAETLTSSQHYDLTLTLHAQVVKRTLLAYAHTTACSWSSLCKTATTTQLTVLSVPLITYLKADEYLYTNNQLKHKIFISLIF
jgi:hypothetical protein